MSRKRNIQQSTNKLQCVCRQLTVNLTTSGLSTNLLQCSYCDGLFHKHCVNAETEDLESDVWNCPSCIESILENPCLSQTGIQSLQGRNLPTSGWGEMLLTTDIDDKVLDAKIQTKRHRIEGYNLFKEDKVTSLCSNKSQLGHFVYYKGTCSAAMKDKIYNINICLKDVNKTIKWAHCSCAAGIDGECKHVVAVLYFIIDLCKQGLTKIPNFQSCTEKLQTWHVRKPLTDEPLLFDDIKFVRHDPFKPQTKEPAVNLKYHNPVPDFGKIVKKERIKVLVDLFGGEKSSLPIISTILSNGCEPVLNREQSVGELHNYLFESIKCTSFNFEPKPFTNKDHEVFYNRMIHIDTKAAMLIEKHTRMQSKSSRWYREREYRLTGSIFGPMCQSKSNSDPVKIFKQKKQSRSSKSLIHGITYESVAFAQYIQKFPLIDASVGLVINPKLPFLGVSPDRLVMDNGQLKLVEIKCPYSIHKNNLSIDAMVGKPEFYLEHDVCGLKIKTKHDYYFQIQGQLNICGIETCDLVVFVPPSDMCVVNIKRDIEFFNLVMLPRLSCIWFENLLPYFTA